MRDPLHPADEFEAFRDLAVTGLGADDIAARFGVTPRVVKERMKLGAVSPALMALYRQGAMTLEQLMAFTVTDDHTRQQQVWDNLSYDKSASRIRKSLLESHTPATDRRAKFVTLAAYEAAGGVIVRDLIAEDGGGYLTDPALLDRLARTKLEEAIETIRPEGWKWIEAEMDFPHSRGLARVYPRDVELSDAETARLDEIEAELDPLCAELEEAVEPDPDLERRIAALNDEYERIGEKQRAYEPEDVARAGVFVCIGDDGRPEIARGFVRSEDVPVEEPSTDDPSEATTMANDTVDPVETGEDNEPSHLSGALIADLSAHRTMALRDALATHPNIALAAVTHALALDRFYLGMQFHSCLRISAHHTQLETSAPGIGASVTGRSIEARQEAWAARLPSGPRDLWAFVLGLPAEDCLSLLAHCVSFAVDAVETGATMRSALAHSDLLAESVALDMRVSWKPTVKSYFGRVSKALIQEAVLEGASSKAAEWIAGFKKAEMTKAAEELLKDTGWLPKPLRRRDVTEQKSDPVTSDDMQQAAE